MLVAISYNKKKINVTINDGEKLVIVIALGYGIDDAKPRKTKTIEKLGNINNKSPEWLINGLKASQLALTARNQQKFELLTNGNVKAETSFGFFNKIDLGIDKYHFEIGANSKYWNWE